MHSLNLRATDLAKWQATRRGSHTGWSEVHVRTLNGRFVAELQPLTGQVDVDADAEVTRSASLTLYDPDEVLDGLHAMRYMLHVRDITYVPGLSSLAVCPTFTGPIMAPPTRSGSEVTVSCQDPSAIGMLGVYPKTYPRHANARATIKAILSDKCGESAFRFEQSKRRLSEAVTVGWEDDLRPLVQVLAIADDMGLQLFWDGDGIPVLRERPSRSMLSLDGLLSSTPTEEVVGNLVNRVQVEGKKPAYQGAAIASDAHPLSPAALRRNGAERYYNHTETSKAGSDKQAADRAEQVLGRALRGLRESRSFTIAPLPNFDPLDVVSAGGDRVVMDRFSIPVNDGEQTVGYTAPVSSRRSRRAPATAAPKQKKRDPKKGGKR